MAPEITGIAGRRSSKFPALRRALLVIPGLFIAYVPPLTRSLWVDETGTWWMAYRGPLAAIQRTFHWPGQSILFAVITSFFCIDPASPLRDLALRIPALAGAAATCYFVYRFAEDGFGRGAGRIAAVICAFSPLTITFATQARPYTLAMAAASASGWALFRWAQSRERRWLAGYVVSSALVIGLHYLFVPVFAAHAVFLAYELIGKKRRERSGEILAGYLVVAFLITPLIPHMLLLLRESHTLGFAEKPTGMDLARLLMPPLFTTAAFGAALLVHFIRPTVTEGNAGGTRAGLSTPAGFMLIAWWALGPLVAFELTLWTTTQLFVHRYLSYAGPAFALLLAYAGYSALGPRTGLRWIMTLVAIVTAGNVIILPGSFGVNAEEVGPLMQAIRNESSKNGGDAPVLFQSALVESNFQNWRAGDSPGSYLFTPFAAYPVKNKLVPLPSRMDADAQDYVDGLLGAELRNSSKVLFVPHESSWMNWGIQRFQKAGFSYRSRQVNAYWLIVFERPAAHLPPTGSIDPP
jgi:Dolichyl-phosphate-mannose-protein mannosyltransferase